MVTAALVVEWLHIDGLRRTVAELEQTCQSAYTDKHLLTSFNDDQSRLPNSQHFAAEVGRTEPSLDY